MAGDWLKIEKATRRKSEVLAIAAELGVSRGEAFDLCVGFWEWAEEQTADGVIDGVSPAQLDEIVGRPGFSHALLKVDWLQVRSGSLVVPRFARHMGQSAKKRALDANRKAAVRNSSAKMSASEADKCPQSSSLLFSQNGGTETVATGGRDPPRESRGFVPPTVEEVRAYCAERGNSVDPEHFVDHYTANGWVQGRQGKPIKDWKACVRTWEKIEFRSNGSVNVKPGFLDGLREFAARAAADGSLHKEHGT
jgi:hypothetical protein